MKEKGNIIRDGCGKGKEIRDYLRVGEFLFSVYTFLSVCFYISF